MHGTHQKQDTLLDPAATLRVSDIQRASAQELLNEGTATANSW